MQTAMAAGYLRDYGLATLPHCHPARAQQQRFGGRQPASHGGPTSPDCESVTLAPRAKRRLRRLRAMLWRRFAQPAIPLAFLHVPKSAGTAFTYAIEAALLPGRMVTGFDRSTFGDFTAFGTMPRRTRRLIHLSPADIPTNTDFLSGHFARSTVQAALPSARQFMLLREPSARVLSQWAYWRALPETKQREWGDWSQRIRLAHQNLARFLAEPGIACQTDNAYVRALLWPHSLIPDADFIPAQADARLIDAALDALSHLSFAGILEDPGLRVGLERFLGRKLTIPALNVTRLMPDGMQTPMQAELTPEALHLVDARSRLDRRLWQSLAERLMPPHAVRTLEFTTFEKIQARYSELMH